MKRHGTTGLRLRLRWFRAALCALCLFAHSCGDAGRTEQGRRISVFVTVPPEAYLVERIGGDRVNVNVLVGTDQDPHVYEPLPRQMVQLAESKVFFTIGVPLEERVLAKVAGAGGALKIVDVNRSAGRGGHDRRKDRVRERRRDPHTWMSLKLAKVHAQNICTVLAQIDPEHSAAYQRNLRALLAELDRVDEKIARELAPFKGGVFFVFHPALGYFAKDYGLEQVAVEHEGKEPGSKHLVELIEKAKRLGVKAVLVQEQTAKTAAKTFADTIGAEIIRVNPLAKNYLENMESIAWAVKKAAVARKRGLPARRGE